jgi:hypothetical protein
VFGWVEYGQAVKQALTAVTDSHPAPLARLQYVHDELQLQSMHRKPPGTEVLTHLPYWV